VPTSLLLTVGTALQHDSNTAAHYESKSMRSSRERGVHFAKDLDGIPVCASLWEEDSNVSRDMQLLCQPAQMFRDCRRRMLRAQHDEEHQPVVLVLLHLHTCAVKNSHACCLVVLMSLVHTVLKCKHPHVTHHAGLFQVPVGPTQIVCFQGGQPNKYQFLCAPLACLTMLVLEYDSSNSSSVKPHARSLPLSGECAYIRDKRYSVAGPCDACL
jgi:hypothetical protein